MITAMAFQPSLNTLSQCLLAIITASNEVLVADVNNMTYLALPLVSSSSSAAAGAAAVPDSIRQLPNALTGLTFDHADPMKVLIYGQSMIVHIDLREPIPDKPRVTSTNEVASRKSLKKKRKHTADSATDSTNFSTLSLFRSIVHAGSLERNRLVSACSLPVYPCLCLCPGTH